MMRSQQTESNSNAMTPRRPRASRRRGVTHPLLLVVSAGLAIVVSPAAALQDRDASLPVTGITLYRSGVGYFERQGTIDGDATVRLRFDAEQVNDILKSMIVLDRSGGRVGGVSYASNEPLERRLGSFAIDLSNSPRLKEILDQIRGARVRLGVPDGDLTGTILGTEERRQAVQGGQSVLADYVNVLTGTGLRSLPLEQVRTFEILDEALKAELDRALAALASNRADRIRSVDVDFQGRGARDVFIGYVHESPVWKTSYRLILPDASEGGQPTLQGWAIVENTTDDDWRDVRLSLVSGSPVGFRMDLYEPLYVERPLLPVPAAAMLRPKSYAAGVSRFATDESSGDMRQMRERRLMDAAPGAAASMPRRSVSADDMAAYAPGTQATGGEVGEVFLFTLDEPITIERQQSAMVPILTSAIEGRRVSIYSGQERTPHPMRGVELTNSAGLDLMPGPISVFDGPAYSGDAIIDHTPRGSDRLLSYAGDLAVRASVEDRGENRVERISIVDGVLIRSTVTRSTTTYTFRNTDEQRPRTMIVEHPVHNGWSQVEGPDPTERVNAALNRYELTIEPGAEQRLRVTFERSEAQRFTILDTNPANLIARFQQDRMPQEVLEKLQEAARLRAAVADAETQVHRLAQERSSIEGDQSRLRENLRVVDRQSELHARYLTRLSEQENRLETLHEEQREAERLVQERQEAYRAFLRNLRAG
ncbi:MAG: hypothetical protein EA378_11115 [Phycisphaerales bacterium]|nr:MAG: hypothetical protein EA378_11115 [Phycisphaerales bacterium]